MKIVILMCFVAFACATPQLQLSDDGTVLEQFSRHRDPEIQIDDDGHYVLSVVDEDGITLEEQGEVLTDTRTGEEIVITKKTGYYYPGEDGQLVRVAYDLDQLNP